MNSVQALVDHLFRSQSGQIVASLTRLLGFRNLDVAEDISQETLLRALQSWPLRGVPDNPGAWLMTTAKNLAIDRLRQRGAWRAQEPAIRAALQSQALRVVEQFDERQVEALEDDLLAMMFVCCHPSISEEGRVALTLKVLCGFSLREIAGAFLTSEKTVAQRIARAKTRLRRVEKQLRVPSGAELVERQESVLTTLYLLFTEGYSPHDGPVIVREELCFEAIRLLKMLVGRAEGDTPLAHALLALMWFQASRLQARRGDDGGALLLSEQDRSKWDQRLVGAGMRQLELSRRGDELTSYHLQAGIAMCHAVAPSYNETDWACIVGLYDQLIALSPSPLFLLNRAIALSMVHGPQAGIDAASELISLKALGKYPYLPAALAEFYMRQGNTGMARRFFSKALAFAPTEPDRQSLLARILRCGLV